MMLQQQLRRRCLTVLLLLLVLVTAAEATNTSKSGSVFFDSVVPWMMRAGGVTVGLVAIAGGLLYHKQESLLYFPEIGGIPRSPGDNPRGYRSPRERNLPHDDLRIKCRDGVHIHAWLLKYTKNGVDQPPNTPTLLFFHGNAGNIGLRLPNAMQMVQALHANVMMVEYRGFGNSDSVKPTEAGLKLDAQAALHYVMKQRDDLDKSRVYAFGRSLGGAVAFDLALHAEQIGSPLRGVIVENTFTSISDMVDKVLPFLSPIKRFVLRIGWRSDLVAPQLEKTGVLYLAGSRDELVPHAHMQQLYQSSLQAHYDKGAPQPAWHIIEGGTHNESWQQGGTAYWQAFQNFLGSSSTTTTTSQQGDNVIPIMGNNFASIVKDVTGGSSTKPSTPSKDSKKQE